MVEQELTLKQEQELARPSWVFISDHVLDVVKKYFPNKNLSEEYVMCSFLDSLVIEGVIKLKNGKYIYPYITVENEEIIDRDKPKWDIILKTFWELEDGLKLNANKKD